MSRQKDEVSSDSLLKKLGTQDLDVVLCKVLTCRAQPRLDCRSTQLNVVAQKRSGRPRKSWDEVIENDRKKLDMDSADPQSRSEWRGPFEKDLSKSPTLGRGKRALKWI